MTGRDPVAYVLELVKAHDKLTGERLARLEEKVDMTLELLQDFAAAMAAAAEEEPPPAPADQGSILAEAISKLAGEQDQEDELEFPAWGAPKKQKGK